MHTQHDLAVSAEEVLHLQHELVNTKDTGGSPQMHTLCSSFGLKGLRRAGACHEALRRAARLGAHVWTVGSLPCGNGRGVCRGLPA